MKKAAVKKAPSKKSVKPAGKILKIPSTGTLQQRMAAAKRIEALDRPKAEPKRGKQKAQPARLLASAAPAAVPQRNSDFPNTYIQTITVGLEDPDHPVTLMWTGPNASTQETGPFRSSPGAGLRGLNCDDVATSRRSGSNCTPKGTFTVTGFAPYLNSHREATDVTWFLPARGIAFHYYPSVPAFPASHGCVRLETKRIAQLIQHNSRTGLTTVVVDGTWKKPAHQY
ncbi:MAG: L,D-transpeptidase [Chthoniobacteraceae bacterium]